MKYLVFIFSVFLISCSRSSEEFGSGYFSTIQLKIDTVIIDPGDKLLDLRSQILGSDISLDKKYLYNFNYFDHSIEKINLDELRLEKKIPFEREGPNGTGDFMGGIRINSKKSIYHIWNHSDDIIFFGWTKTKNNLL